MQTVIHTAVSVMEMYNVTETHVILHCTSWYVHVHAKYQVHKDTSLHGQLVRKLLMHVHKKADVAYTHG